jgi:hypothetical protein
MKMKETVKFIIAALESNGIAVSPTMSELVLAMFHNEPDDLVKAAALAAIKESKHKTTLASIAEQLALLKPPDAFDHVSPEEAWALVPKDERETSHLSDEMLDAIYRGAVNEYLERDDYIGAERAFKKLYAENIAKSRAINNKPIWRVSLGHDTSMRVIGLERAVSKGAVNSDQAITHDPTNQAIYIAAEKTYIEKLPEKRRLTLAGRVEHLQKSLLALVEAQDKVRNDDIEEPCPSRMKDPIIISKAAELGLSSYEYLVRPCPPHVAAKVHAQLSKQYEIDLSKMTGRR